LSFREKIAWAAFITTLLAWGSYFAVVIMRAANGGTHDPMLFYLFLAATIGQAVMMTADWPRRSPSPFPLSPLPRHPREGGDPE